MELKELKGCPKYLERILYFAGITGKDASLIMYSLEVHEGRPKMNILSVSEASKVMGYLEKHIPECHDCYTRYVKYLNDIRGEISLREADKDHLNLLFDSKSKKQKNLKSSQ